MRLYLSKNNEWTGTQLDAKASGAYEQVEVPTDKVGLMAFLNDLTYAANDDIVLLPWKQERDAKVNFEPSQTDDQMAAISLDQYQSKGQTYPPANTLVGKCSLVELKELSTTLQQLLCRAWSEMEQKQD
ncbi:MAG TPA: hypothetical protein DCR60_07725 [Psychrobacter sp.]|nr:hypothetical protein [Psychrobacter sp.]|tara:strand:+ start:260 stop:646 length:387 start_codon:yes stop_codon:yes gene_type:complete